MKKILVMLALVFACLWGTAFAADFSQIVIPVSYTPLRAHETLSDLG